MLSPFYIYYILEYKVLKPLDRALTCYIIDFVLEYIICAKNKEVKI